MANEENLKPFTSDQSREEAVKNGRKGGIASGKAKRERKLLREAIAERMGEEDFNALVDNLIARAKDSDRAFELLRDTIGEKPVSSIDLTADMDLNITIDYGDDEDEDKCPGESDI